MYDETTEPTIPDLEPTDADLAAVADLHGRRDAIVHELRKVIVGQEQIINELLVALFCRGHCLLVGVPGLAKTLLINSLANILDLTFNRIQFTPDLMPSDITGTDILEEHPETGQRSFRFLKGPIFTNMLLADEINRTPPKTQAALLQAMQEYRVTAGGQTYPLTLPFFVLATQNPIEQEGTYPLPEAQLDRFMFHIGVDYPSFDEEVEIVASTTSQYEPRLQHALDAPRILDLQRLIRRVPAAPHVVHYAVQLVRLSRPNASDAPQFVKDWVSWGAGPRASQFLILGSKARAVLDGRFAASVEDVRVLTVPVLRHRVLTNFNAEADGIQSTDIIERLLEEMERRGAAALAA
ncbi:MAG: MoxR family ATPase [Candidatus Tectomicrobia bacterium]|nr:MoxR family ATPase [Candidatus Tectomicrobia bacterium]